MANKTLTDLYIDNPVTFLTDNDLFEVEQASGSISGAIKKSDLIIPQLPAWTYQGVTLSPTTGNFGTTSSITGNTGGIVLSDSVIGTVSPQFPCWLLFTDNTGLTLSFLALSKSDRINVNPVSTTGNWSGRYTVSILPIPLTAADVGLGSVTNDVQVKVSDIGTTVLAPDGDGSALINVIAINGIDADTGWVANADNGDKTAVIPANATLTAMQAALNLVVSGFGDSFVAIAAKVKALQEVLEEGKKPNV